MFSEGVIKSAQQHAIDSYPRESCGLVVAGSYIACENVAADPTKTFVIADAVSLEYAGRIQGVLHSHCNGPPWPSSSDMRQQIATNVPWGVIATDGIQAWGPWWWGDQVPIAPLIGREFRHGITDCFALGRDWFRLVKGITIRDQPRDWNWWFTGQNLYLDGFKERGFKEISVGELRVGDAILFHIRMPGTPKGVPRFPNHCGIYTGNGQILHHLVDRLSRHDSVGPWISHRTNCLRYVG